MTTQHDLASVEAEKKALIIKAVSSEPVIGIYFLIKQNEIVYIGQSINLHSRMASHKISRIFDFDAYSWVECDKSDLGDTEAEYILRFKPVLNKGFPACGRFISYGKLKARGIGKIKFRNYVAKSSHVQHMFFDYVYYDLRELMSDQAFLDLIAHEGVRNNFPALSA